MRLLIDDDSTCSKDRACAQQPDKSRGALRPPDQFSVVDISVFMWRSSSGVISKVAR